MPSHLITTADQLRQYYPANLSFEYDLVAPYLAQAERGPVRDACGTAMLVKLKLGQYADDKYADMITLIQTVQANYAMAYALMTLSAQTSNLGVTEVSGKDQKPVPLPKLQLIRQDLENAGATWKDDEVIVDKGLVTSRTPDDLPAFCAKLVEEIAEGEHEGQRRSA